MAKLRSHDPGLLAHSLLVTRWTTLLAKRVGASSERLQRLRVAAILHDVGKLTIPSSTLSKPGRLEPQELHLIRNHTIAGYKMLLEEGIHSSEVLNTVHFHHERLDGSGYPYGLKDEQIHEDVRIVMICDIYSALRENRPYNCPMDCTAALERMSEKSSRIDMELFQAFSEVALSSDNRLGGVRLRATTEVDAAGQEWPRNRRHKEGVGAS